MKGVMYGLNTCSLYFGGIKVAIVMWLYGVQTFSTDIHFWLGFKPTQFWKCIWGMLPIFILNLVGVFKSNFKYGPPDLDDRKRRKYFDEITESRQCRHDCMIIDEKYDCNHMPLIFKSRSNVPSAESSLTNIYEGPSGKKTSSVIDVSMLHAN
ncbi:unnamed protein product [Euphydryas editha]|nr:unnamed protein product [Euphydryas editha]